MSEVADDLKEEEPYINEITPENAARLAKAHQLRFKEMEKYRKE